MKVHKLEINEDYYKKTHQPFFSVVQKSAHTGQFALVLFSGIFLYNLLGSIPSARIGRREEKVEGTESSDAKHLKLAARHTLCDHKMEEDVTEELNIRPSIHTFVRQFHRLSHDISRLFQSQFSTKYDLVLPLSISGTLSFP